MYDIFFYLHMIGLAVAVSGIVRADHQALGWFRGKKEMLDFAQLMKYHHTVSWGLGILIVSGAFLFWPAREYLIGNTLFLVKMFFVLVLVVNSIVIRKFLPIATIKTYASLTPKERLPLLVSGGASGISWVGAVVAAVLLFGL